LPKSNAAQPQRMPPAPPRSWRPNRHRKQRKPCARRQKQIGEPAAAEVATARAQRDAAQETATVAVRQAKFEAEEARRALTAAAKERGRLLQRAEAAEAQRSGVAEATAPIDAKPGRSRGTRTGTGDKSAT
jgi:hypothetical protein